MLQALLRSLGVYENSSRLRQEIQGQIDVQSAALRNRLTATAGALVWAAIAGFMALATLVVALCAIYITLDHYFGPEVAIWSVFAITIIIAIIAAMLARSGFASVPHMPPVVVPELYQQPTAALREPSPATGPGPYVRPQSSYYKPAAGQQRTTAEFDGALKDWMVKTATQSFSKFKPGSTSVDGLMGIVTPHAENVARDAIDDVATQIQTGSRSKIAAILGTAVLAGLLAGRMGK